MRKHRTRWASAAIVAALLVSPISAAAVEVGEDAVANGSFEQFTGANPDSWGRWNAAGTGEVTRVPGIAGQNAVQITTNTTSSRLALVQDVPVTAGLYRLDFQVKRTGMSGNGTAGIRINVAGATSAPFIGGNTDTDGWTPASAWVRVPAGSTSARVHLFNDMVRGTMTVDDVRFSRADADDFVLASITASGDIGLDWDVTDARGADHYEIMRETVGSEAEARLVRRVPAVLTEATDQDWNPGESYVYTVIARDSGGAEVFRTTEATITAPDESNILTSSLAAIEAEADVHLSWAAARDVEGPLSLVASDESLAGGDLSDATTVATGMEAVGSARAQTLARYFALVADGEVIATAARGVQSHPRIMFTDEVRDKITRITSVPGTPQEQLEVITARVDGGVGTSGTSAHRYAREAAFLYQVTGQQRYADLTFEAFEIAADETPFGASQPLDTANPASQLALAYDWAYNGWTNTQRTFAQEYFERAAVLLELADHPNMVWDDKASNWVGVTRGAELAQHLAVRGDGDYGMRDARIARLLDQLSRHAEQGYSESGWYQEGLDYLDYDNMIATTGVLGSFDVGIDAIKEAWYEPQTASLLLHAASLRQGTGSSLQWGVGTGGQPAWPLYFDRAAEDGELDRVAAMFERTQGHLAENGWYSPGFGLYTFAYWPEESPPSLRSDEVLPALYDAESGVAMFRNRIQDADDVLIGLHNRNHDHLGWSGLDTFGLSIIGGDTLWAGQPGKSAADAAKYSRVFVDNEIAQEVGHGRTEASRSYNAQGGGYVLFDGAGNLGVATATREAAVDMTPRATADTIMVLSDSFSDDEARRWTWQLAPQAGVTAEIADSVAGAREIVLRNGDAWMQLTLLDADGAEITYADGVLRIERAGKTADFDIVAAFGTGADLPRVEVIGTVIAIDGFVADASDLAAFEPVSAANAWDASASYRAGDRVGFEGSLFEAIRPTSADEPGEKPRGPWQQIRAIGDTSIWTPTGEFQRGDVVLHEGQTYTATRKNRGSEPGRSNDRAWTLTD
ncbi:hypothetical protein JF531_07080 [Microbacterium esteraromaticum]|uniref:hypothetical protein n=1 Tax=Microbacterium esteraromaticum TaxID=57043 RepID=UPI001A8D352A|nr:hypothetical protein [Microbacterium esteraromaticum]MBN8424283.1 hypothetical protein [Microbacterium esteraromaticum]